MKKSYRQFLLAIIFVGLLCAGSIADMPSGGSADNASSAALRLEVRHNSSGGRVANFFT